ncbi:hypothetical protein E8E14_012930 [Neopestalotiopsis sp. 37M]|nr:hypothetical protein E8E14_012930 [Neopestalotiopsis sp. 37M]
MAAITALLSQEWHQSPTNFLAGIWRQDLICGLLWYPANIGPHYRASAYVAPSWSWASIIGGVEYPSLLHMNQWKFFTTMKVLEAETTPVLDPFGQITKGHIKAHGLLTQVELRLCRGKFESSRGEYGVGQSLRPTRVHDDQTVIASNIFAKKKKKPVGCMEAARISDLLASVSPFLTVRASIAFKSVP